MKISANKSTSSIKHFASDQKTLPFIQTAECKKKSGNNSPITLREGECLSWAAIGKTASEIAEILSLSEHTIHFHTRNAIKKLDATNKTHAVAIAIIAKYIVIN